MFCHVRMSSSQNSDYSGSQKNALFYKWNTLAVNLATLAASKSKSKKKKIMLK